MYSTKVEQPKDTLHFFEPSVVSSVRWRSKVANPVPTTPIMLRGRVGNFFEATVDTTIIPAPNNYCFQENIWKVIFYFITLFFKVLFMNEHQHGLDTLKDIRNMMERSSRFISLSGWSGVAAGICALVGAWAAQDYVSTRNPALLDGRLGNYNEVADIVIRPTTSTSFLAILLEDKLFQIAAITFVAAFVSAFVFTYIKSKKQGIPLLGKTSVRLMFSVAVPMIVGGLFVLRMAEMSIYGLIAPACLIFYGLALLNASKYTFTEIRWLGMFQLLLGVLNCWNIGLGLYFWAIGFGVLHIVYGVVMWWKYEREQA